MKKKQSKKLHLNKLTVASLNAAELAVLKGGKAIPPTITVTTLTKCFLCP
jgi:natural product precursor